MYFGGSSWSISWLHYILGPMKCYGKKHPYPSEIKIQKEQKKEIKMENLIIQVKENEHKLKILDDKVNTKTSNITKNLQSKINTVTQVLNEDSEEWQEKMKSLRSNYEKIQQQQLDLLTAE